MAKLKWRLTLLVLSVCYWVLITLKRCLDLKCIEMKNTIQKLQQEDTKKELVTIMNNTLAQVSVEQGYFSTSSELTQEQECFLLWKKDDFQWYVHDFFIELGLKCPFPYKNRKDLGSDGYFIYNGFTYQIQAKTTEVIDKKLTVDDLRVFAGVQCVKADFKIFITNSLVTEGFIHEAHAAGIYVLDSEKMLTLIANKEWLKLQLEINNQN